MIKDNMSINEEFKLIESLESDFAKYGIEAANQAVLEMVSKNGHHLIDIGEHVEVWLLDKYCLMFEDTEMIAAFAHHDKEDHVLIEYVYSFYLNELSAMKIKH